MWEKFIDIFSKVYRTVQDRNNLSEDKEIAITASAFIKNCLILIEKYEADKMTMPIVPMIISFVFSIELNIKSLLCKNNIVIPTDKQGHDLCVLFSKLPLELRNKITQF